jgi:hypothetical protein
LNKENNNKDIGAEIFIDLDNVKEFYNNKFLATKKIIDSIELQSNENPFDLRAMVWRKIQKENSLEFSCKHSRFELTKWRTSNNVIVFRNQCLDCGRIANQKGAKKYSKGNEYWFNKNAEEFSRDINTKTYSKISEYIDKKINDYELKRKEQKDLDYKKYLQTPEWKAKRERVLIRDNYLCQGCLQNRAVDVHHMSYANFGDELFFQLISLCKECHEKVHKDKNK